MASSTKSSKASESIEESGVLHSPNDDHLKWKISRVENSTTVITQISLTKTTPKRSASCEYTEHSNPASPPSWTPGDASNAQHPQSYSFNTPYNVPNVDYANMYNTGSHFYTMFGVPGYIPSACNCFTPTTPFRHGHSSGYSYPMYFCGQPPQTPQAFQHRCSHAHY